jgi:hypothetical protein
MSRGQRLALLGVAAVIAIIAVVLLRPGAEEQRSAPTGSTEQPPSSRGDGERSAQQGPPRAPAPPTIRLRDGRRVGVEEITVKSGDRVRFVVISDERAEVHIHGYDRTVNVRPQRPARVSFPADVEGLFEIESHDTGAELASLRVVP